MSGYFALHRSVIEGCTLKPEGYKILLEVLGRGQYRTVVEVPYIFIERQQGQSKLGLRQYREFVTHLLRLSWETQRAAAFCEVLSRWGNRGDNEHGSPGYPDRGRHGILPGWGLAVETAIGTNFLLHEFWSFADHARRHSGIIPRLFTVPQIQSLLCWRSRHSPDHSVALNGVWRLPLSAEQLGWDYCRHSVELWDECQSHMGISAC